MPVAESVVAAVVADVSSKMASPRYAELAVGAFTSAHPDAARWIAAQSKALGGSEGVVHAVFHAEVLSECLRRARSREARAIGFRELDRVSRGDAVGKLRTAEPALADYLASNVDAEAARSVLALVALALALA
jgi:hypothetical protein